jgi:hypothetical protein
MSFLIFISTLIVAKMMPKTKIGLNRIISIKYINILFLILSKIGFEKLKDIKNLFVYPLNIWSKKQIKSYPRVAIQIIKSITLFQIH